MLTALAVLAAALALFGLGLYVALGPIRPPGTRVLAICPKCGGWFDADRRHSREECVLTKVHGS